jgi:hypothetical protein
MKKRKLAPTIPSEVIMNQIYYLRGHKVMLDIHLSTLYGVETRVLKQAVRRNMDLFPSDFMFTLTTGEVKIMVSQNVIPSKQVLGGAFPYAFTETGVVMLSSVLKSKKARAINIAIMRAFVALRKMLMDNTELRLAIEEIKKKTEKNTKSIDVVFKYLDELIDKKENPPPRKLIGFKASKKKS